MKTKFNGIFTLLLALVVQITFAQDRTISGIVSDETGPLPGVSVLKKGTTQGTETDFDGKYSIKAKTGDVLVFSFVGVTSEKTVGSSNTIDVSIVSNVLDEVVVTALGVKKEKKSLGYSISKVSSEEVAQKPSGDVARLMKGKAAGVNITSSNGTSGSSTNIVIRGYSSITGSNQPLFVVDGVPFGSDTNSNEAFFDNAAQSSRFLDLDPNNIEEINILKGLSATALYGNRGRNGVILITTKNNKNGTGKTTVTVGSSVFMSTPHLPDYQKQYGNGFNQEFGWYFSNWGPRFGDTDASKYGRFLNEIRDGKIYLKHPFSYIRDKSLLIGYENLVDSDYEYKNYNSVEDFFRTGLFLSNSVSINGGNENYSYNIGYTKTDDRGFLPGNSVSKDNFSIGGSAMFNKLKVTGSFNISKTDYETPPIAASRGSGVIGDGSSVYGDLFYTPKSVNLMGLPYQAADGRSLYYRSSNNIQNPRWTVANSKTGQLTDRFFGNISLMYPITDNLIAKYTYGLDTYNEKYFYYQNKGGVDGNQQGIYRTQYIRNNIQDHNFSLSYDTNLNESLNLKAIVGFNPNSIKYDRDGLESTGQVTFGVLKHWNFTNTSSKNSFNNLNFQRSTENNTVGFYGDFTLGYNDYLFLNTSMRYDQTSTLEKENNSIFYPSVSVSFIPTEAFESITSENGLNYLKARIGYGTSAGFPPVYSTRDALNLTGRAFIDGDGNVVTSNATSSRLGNKGLKPELISELEVGIDSRFFRNRIGLNFSGFLKKTTDLITDKDLDPSTGYRFSYINGGDMETKGIEVDLDAHILKSSDRGFNWKSTFSFYADESEVTRLPDGVDQIIIGDFISDDAKNAAIVGQPFGVFIGTSVKRDDNGDKIVNASTGSYVIDPSNTVIGDPNPDFTMNFGNTFSYKGFSLSASLGYTKGGDIYSKTAGYLQNRGLVNFPLSRLGTYVLPGVNIIKNPDGSTTSQPNATQIGATDAAFRNWNNSNEFEVWDATTIRLSEVTLGYSFDRKILENTLFSSLSITFTGSNLWYKAVNMPEGVNVDTNALSNGVGNNRGLEYLTGPSAKRYGFSIRATF